MAYLPNLVLENLPILTISIPTVQYQLKYKKHHFFGSNMRRFVWRAGFSKFWAWRRLAGKLKSTAIKFWPQFPNTDNCSEARLMQSVTGTHQICFTYLPKQLICTKHQSKGFWGVSSCEVTHRVTLFWVDLSGLKEKLPHFLSIYTHKEVDTASMRPAQCVATWAHGFQKATDLLGEFIFQRTRIESAEI